ncbi:MAG TPA: hypothetical protein VGD67_09895 [Pseudonocardiaceae bacterium]
MEDQFRDDRWYGARYGESAGEDLCRVAGRILSDIALDQGEGRLPQAVTVVSVEDGALKVQLFVQADDDSGWTVPQMRSRVTQVADRYNWEGKHNRSDVRFRFGCLVSFVHTRLTASTIGAVISS